MGSRDLAQEFREVIRISGAQGGGQEAMGSGDLVQEVQGASVFLEPRGWLGGYGVWRPSTGGSGGCQGTRGSRGLSEDRKSGGGQGIEAWKWRLGAQGGVRGSRCTGGASASPT